MKKRIIIGLACFTAIFFLGGIYIIGTIQKATSTLDRLITLHQVQILREQLLIDVKRTQLDLAFEHTRYAKGIDTVITNVVLMDEEARRCTGCHHDARTTAKIMGLQGDIQTFETALSRILTMRAGDSRVLAEHDRAFQAGGDLINQLTSIVVSTKAGLEKKTQTSLEGIGSMKTLLFVLITAGPILAIGLAVIFIKGITTPLDVIVQATRKVKGGDLDFRIQGLRDEFGEVAASFNEMASSLNEQMRNLQRAEQMKLVGEMAAGLVHEIKNPLTGIKASMQVLIEQGGFGGEDKTVLLAVLDETKRIEALMKSLLDFAKPPMPHPIPVDINNILESTIAFSLPYSSVAPRTPGSIQTVKDLDPSLPSTLADPGQMQQVFLNLLINALDAMPEGGTLTVGTAAGEDRRIKIEIRDTGKGIDEKMREEIFRPFFTTKHKGTGLGLAVSKRFVEMQGGTISVEGNKGGGTVFRILLPAADP